MEEIENFMTSNDIIQTLLLSRRAAFREGGTKEKRRDGKEITGGNEVKGGSRKGRRGEGEGGASG